MHEIDIMMYGKCLRGSVARELLITVDNEPQFYPLVEIPSIVGWGEAKVYIRDVKFDTRGVADTGA